MQKPHRIHTTAPTEHDSAQARHVATYTDRVTGEATRVVEVDSAEAATEQHGRYFDAGYFVGGESGDFRFPADTIWHEQNYKGKHEAAVRGEDE